MSTKLVVKSAYGEGLSLSQVWCDVLNFLVGISCIINGFRWRRNPRVLFFTGKIERIHLPETHEPTDDIPGFAYCAVTLISLIGFCLGKKFGGEKTQFWSRVWMFPVVTPLFILAIILSLGRYCSIEFPIQFTVALLGYVWFLTSLIILVCRKFGCYCEKKTANIQSRSDCVENIYENNSNIQNDLI